MVGDNGDNGEGKGNDAAVINCNTSLIIKIQLIIIEDHVASKQQLRILPCADKTLYLMFRKLLRRTILVTSLISLHTLVIYRV